VIALRLWELGNMETEVTVDLDLPPDFVIYKGRLFTKVPNAGIDDGGCWRYQEEELFEIKDPPPAES
jgi:hypothetical protein